jgi:hypothetical protein
VCSKKGLLNEQMSNTCLPELLKGRLSGGRSKAALFFDLPREVAIVLENLQRKKAIHTHKKALLASANILKSLEQSYYAV